MDSISTIYYMCILTKKEKITAKDIQTLRAKTSAGVMACKSALEKSKGIKGKRHNRREKQVGERTRELERQNLLKKIVLFFGM